MKQKPTNSNWDELTDEPSLQLLRMLLPPGTTLSDFFIDAQTLCIELNISKRHVAKLKQAGWLCHTNLAGEGKAFYLKQELAALMIANVVIGKNSILSKLDFSKKPEIKDKK